MVVAKRKFEKRLLQILVPNAIVEGRFCKSDKKYKYTGRVSAFGFAANVRDGLFSFESAEIRAPRFNGTPAD